MICYTALLYRWQIQLPTHSHFSSLKAKSTLHHRGLNGICSLFKLFAVRVILFWQIYKEANLVGGDKGREMVLRNVFLSEKKKLRNGTEAFSFPPSLLWTLSLKIDTWATAAILWPWGNVYKQLSVCKERKAEKSLGFWPHHSVVETILNCLTFWLLYSLSYCVLLILSDSVQELESNSRQSSL